MKLLYTTILLLIHTVGFAQPNLSKTTIDNRLLAAFEASYLQRIQYKNPALLQRWTFYLDNAYYLADYIPKKFNKDMPSITIKDLSNINIFRLEKQHKHLKRDWNKPMAYRISGTNKILVYHSGKQFNKDFRKWLELAKK